MQTPATKLLDALGITWIAHEYDHGPHERDFGKEAALKLNLDPAQVFKTLIVKADVGFVVAVIPVNAMLDLKAAAAAVGGKKAEMAEVLDAERITGYVHGGISPLGQRKKLPTVVDQSAMDFPTMFVSGGRRGFDVEVAPADLLLACDGSLATLRR